MKTIKSLLAAIGCAVLALTGVLIAPSSASADTVTRVTAPQLRFTSYNICGNMCGNPNHYDNQRRIDQVVAETSADVWGADQIFLSEVCRSQYDAILAKLAPKGFSGLYTATLSGYPTICHGSDYGMAAFVKGPALETTVLDLTQGGESEPIKNPCIKSRLQGRITWSCSIHLYWSASPTLRDAEARELAAQAKAWEDAGIPVVLGGDFNAPPASTMASYFYEPALGGGAKGTMIEVDETDRDYFTPACLSAEVSQCRSGQDSKDGGKIDYVFLSAKYFANPKADVLPMDTKVSDHKLLRGAATWKHSGQTTGSLSS
ncbi:endonuclease/exonuclease/phosphatase family protein [Streptomyces sp. NBC_01320]|uniref:endonuclease/exonuclease/phosphatase family protein n=1 Tax=Streptomyces sp. NBC_01320 TaxID=2903824 RepID=UPI002E0D9E56|nr:endonuclease/exonuclease/phosphatase family protein [Streptomyces sp. NBC_01320]WSK01096.1 endonuclease/exonuclease/phosphatase family protein [Streptomyces sp. NBC_01320]